MGSKLLFSPYPEQLHVHYVLDNLGQWSLGRFEDTFLHAHGHFNIPGLGFRLLTVKNFSSSVIKIDPPMVKPFWFKNRMKS